MSDHRAAEPPREFVDEDLRGARFVRSDLSGSVMRGVILDGADLDAPWLLGEGGSLRVNGVDVAPLVDAELDRRFPGRSQRRAADADGLRTAWRLLEDAWGSALTRAARLPDGAVDLSVDGEWSFAQTLRHLVMATDVWLRGAVLRIPQPLHPLGVPHAEYATDGYDLSVFTTTAPTYAEVLDVRAERVAQVRDYLAGVSDDVLDEPRPHPWDPEHAATVRSCLHVVLEEEWEHLRFALRDLDALEATGFTR